MTSISKDSRREKQKGFQQHEERMHDERRKAEWERDEPHNWKQYDREQGDRPAQHQ